MNTIKNRASYTGGVAIPTLLLFIALIALYTVLWLSFTRDLLSGWLVSLLGAFLAYGMFTVVHEACHGNIAGGNDTFVTLERSIGWVASMTLFFPYSAFRVIHLQHHAHTNDPEKDPDGYVNGKGIISVILRCITLVGHYYKETFTNKNAIDNAIKHTRATSWVFVIFTSALGLGLLLGGLGWEYLYVFVIPALLAAPFLGFTFDWLPHYPHHNMGKMHNTRIVTIPGLEYLSLFQSYHHIHHLHPRIPFYKYKLKFKAISEELRNKDSPIEGFGSDDKSLLRAVNTYSDIVKGSPWHYALEVAKINELAPDAIEITFKRLGNLPYGYKAGQYVVLSKQVDGQTISRCYSICSDPSSGDLCIGIKRVPLGKMSNALIDLLKVGSKISVRGPFGDFGLQDCKTPNHHIFIAGGSGITPILSMIRQALAHNSAKVTLLYGSRTPHDILFKKELLALSRKHSSQFSIHFTQELLTAAYQLKFMEDFERDGFYYLCGPPLMMQASQKALLQKGVEPAHIIVESFSTPEISLSGPLYAISKGNRRITGYASETILEASIRDGKALPYACGMGQCGTCKVSLLSGNVQWKNINNTALLEEEKKQGYILSCICSPASDITIK